MIRDEIIDGTQGLYSDSYTVKFLDCRLYIIEIIAALVKKNLALLTHVSSTYKIPYREGAFGILEGDESYQNSYSCRDMTPLSATLTMK